MKIKLAKGIEEGRKYEKAWIDGKPIILYALSRRLTRATYEDDRGIFTAGTIDIWRGDVKKTFQFEEIGEFTTEEYVEGLRRRIKEVREWVREVDYEKSIEFEIDDIE